MKFRGTSENGNPLVELDVEDRQAMLAAGVLLSSLSVIDGAGMKAATPPAVSNAGGETRVCFKCGKTFVPVRKDQSCCSKACRNKCGHRKPAKIGTPAVKTPAVNKPGRLCLQCKQPLPADAHPLRRLHEGECTDKFNAAKARAAYSDKHPKQTAQASAPATPPAPTAQSRLDMIRDADRRARETVN